MMRTQTAQVREPTVAGPPAHAAYWRSQLAGLGDKTCIPADLQPRAGAEAATAAHVVDLPPELVQRLDEMTRSQPAALHVALTTALIALLHRYTGADEVVVGQPAVAPAAFPGTMLVLRGSVGPESTFRDLLMQLRTSVLAAVAHQDYRVELLAEEIGRSAADGDNPYFDVALELSGLHDPAFAATSGARLLVSAARGDGGLRLTLRYDATRFEGATIARFAEHYVALLGKAVAEPDRALGDLDLHLPGDGDTVAGANATVHGHHLGTTIHELFARQAAATPDAPALVGPAGPVSYAELDARSTRLARSLQDRGVRPGSLVGVLAERSPEMVVALFAVLKAGGAYLPLDPAYPAARIAYLLADSRTSLVLAQSRFTASVAPGVEVLALDAEDSYAAGAESLRPGAGPDDLAYVIYTSGSTGNPKGVMIEHRSVVNRLLWMQRAYPIGPGDVILQKTSVSFDVSVWELFWWAFTGATLALLEPGGEKDPATILAAIEDRGVTTLHFVPSMFSLFLAHVDRSGAAARLRSLRQVFTSGEALGPSQARRFRELAGGARLVNLYGPTEATVDVTHQPCDEVDGVARIPIGRPIDNLRAYVLDAAGRPAPVGLPGELYLAGVGLARGYLHRPDLTGERFVSGSAVGEARLYRTGDRARWLPDGTLDYLGRMDLQVKVRGFRVEPGEIEERLRAHPHVEDAAVVASGDGWQTSLRGYVVLGGTVSEQELKAHVRQTLPEYMVPAQIVTLDTLPLTPNGKLDRAALSRPGGRHQQVLAKVAPRDERERTLAGIWETVLGYSEIGVFDNFFALGGNSIHFVSVLAQARAAGLDFTFQQLFTHQTIAALARSMAGHQTEPPHAADAADAAAHRTYRPFELLAAEDRAKLGDDVEDAYPMSLLQAGLVFQTEITGSAGQYHDVLGYLIEAPFDAAAFEEAVRIMVGRHPVLRTAYHLTGLSEFVQVVRRDVPLPLSVVDLRGQSREEQERYNSEWVAREKARPFQWEEGGFVTLHVQILSDDLFRYAVSQHNSALDGWSISLLHTQLFELYFRLRDGRDPDSHAVDNHLRNFVGLERAAIASPPSRDFWRRMLDGVESTNVPRRADARDTGDFAVILHDVAIPPGLTQKVDALAEALSVPVKDVLLAAHVKVLSVVAGEREVMTGYEHSGRPELPDAEAALGLFLNTVPLRIDLVDGSWEQLVRQVYQAEVELLPYRRYPMAQMKQDLATQRTLFETTFNFTHFYLLKKLRELPAFSLLDMRVDSETEFVFRTEFSRHFFDDDIRLCLHYHTHLFDAEQIERIGGYFVRALELMTTQPRAPHDEQPLASAAELERARRVSTGGLDVLDGRYRDRIGDAAGVEVHVLDRSLLPAPLGSPGEIVLGGPAGFAGEEGVADPASPGRHLLRTGDRGRWLPDGRLEAVSGKDRATPPAQAAPPPGTAPAVDLADSSTMRDIAAAWAGVLDLPVERIGPSDGFFELGGNSLSALRVVLELDGLVTLTDLTRHPRLEELARLVEHRAEPGGEDLLQLLSSTDLGTRCALICCPYPAGHPINFQPLADALEETTSDIAVYGIEQPGHDPSRPRSFVGVEETARLLVDQIAERLETPVMLWGHCGGASITLELARQLEERGFDLRHVFVGSKLLPTAQDMNESVEMIEGWSDDDIIRYMVDETGYALEDLRQQHIDFIARVFRHDVLNGYRYFLDASRRQAWKIRAPFTFVVAADDAALAHHPAEYGRWGKLAADVRLHVVGGGGHYFVRTNPTQTAALVQSEWDRAAAPQED